VTESQKIIDLIRSKRVASKVTSVEEAAAPVAPGSAIGIVSPSVAKGGAGGREL
jgi:hypothetical protein